MASDNNEATFFDTVMRSEIKGAKAFVPLIITLGLWVLSMTDFNSCSISLAATENSERPSTRGVEALMEVRMVEMLLAASRAD